MLFKLKIFSGLYIELDKNKFTENAVSKEIIKEVLSTYFKYIDQDYKDLKR